MASLDNANPLVFGKSTVRKVIPEEEDDNVADEIDSREVFGKKSSLTLALIWFYMLYFHDVWCNAYAFKGGILLCQKCLFTL